MTLPLKVALVRRPNTAFQVDKDNIQQWHYKAPPHLPSAQREHDYLVSLLKKRGVQEIFYHDEEDTHGLADSIFVHDPVLMTNNGAIILRMGKILRRGEEELIEISLKKIGVPVIYKLHGNATAEGGDLVWLDEGTLAVGRGYRTNDEGIRQLGEALNPMGVNVLVFQLPYYYGPEACLHLQSLISFVNDNTAVVYLPLLPVPLVEYLEKNNISLIQVPQNEFENTMGTNVLSLGNNICVMLEGNHVTVNAIRNAGIEVFEYKGDEISLKAEGGATCLVRPIFRTRTFIPY